jgi:hypothetical protein
VGFGTEVWLNPFWDLYNHNLVLVCASPLNAIQKFYDNQLATQLRTGKPTLSEIIQNNFV